MLHFEFVEDEPLHGEPPPTIWIFGEKSDFHRLLLKFLPFLTEGSYSVNNCDLDIFPSSPKIIELKKSTKFDIISSDTHLEISLNEKSINSIISVISHLSYKIAHFYSDDDYFKELYSALEQFFEGVVICESVTAERLAEIITRK